MGLEHGVTAGPGSQSAAVNAYVVAPPPVVKYGSPLASVFAALWVPSWSGVPLPSASVTPLSAAAATTPLRSASELGALVAVASSVGTSVGSGMGVLVGTSVGTS